MSISWWGQALDRATVILEFSSVMRVAILRKAALIVSKVALRYGPCSFFRLHPKISRCVSEYIGSIPLAAI
jgi:hypothetical protein